MPKALLFDIDGTLIKTAGAGAKSCKEAIETGFQKENADVDVDYGGRTDLSLIREFFKLNDIPLNSENISIFFRCYKDALPRHLSVSGGVVLPGVWGLLEELKKHPDVYLGLVTGNCKDGAAAKLGHFDLWQEFGFGAYGDEAEDRNQIARLGYERAGEVCFGIEREDVVVIGDTPKDITCGRSIGAKVVAVLTGYASEEDIRREKPDLVLENLEDVGKMLGFLGRG